MKKKKVEAGEIAAVLREIGQRLEISGESPYRVKAYYRAADSLKALTRPLSHLVEARRLQEIPGVGEAIASKIVTLHENGSDPTLEALREKLPSSILDLLRVPGLPTAKIKQLHESLNVTTLDELEAACLNGSVAKERGLGPALQKKILQGIAILRKAGDCLLLDRAGDLSEAIAIRLRDAHPDLARITVAGAFRRGHELVDDLRLAAAAGDRFGPMRVFPVEEADLYVAAPRQYGLALLMATGSTEHVEALQAHAASRGFSLDETGLRRGNRQIVCRDERKLYRALGLQFIPPELREGSDEIALAAAKRLPDLVERGDLRGILHAHTDFSDGRNTLAEMAEATRALGYAYFGISDHSRSASYAGGLDIGQIEAQHAMIDELNRGYGDAFRIFKGIESDILEDGSLDYPDAVLDRFDFIVASVHSRFRLDEAQQTQRILRAVANPYTTILGHMTGRLLLRREGYRIDIERILRACAENGVAVEINGNPKRLDLDWRWHRRAVELGCMLSVNPDAHSIAELDLTRWGLAMARKGGVSRQHVLNALDAPDFARHLADRRRRRSRLSPGKKTSPAAATGDRRPAKRRRT